MQSLTGRTEELGRPALGASLESATEPRTSRVPRPAPAMWLGRNVMVRNVSQADR